LQPITEEEAADQDIQKWAEEHLTPLAIEDKEYLMQLLAKVPVPKAQVTQLWMHNPKNIHEDILVPAHTACIDKVKTVYAKLGEPTQDDWKDPRFPTVVADKVVLKTLAEYLAVKVLDV
jgi:hypothetical protein